MPCSEMTFRSIKINQTVTLGLLKTPVMYLDSVLFQSVNNRCNVTLVTVQKCLLSADILYCLFTCFDYV
jgi:hypothetical protein